MRCIHWDCDETVRWFPHVRGWRGVVDAASPGLKRHWYCPEHVEEARAKSVVTCAKTGCERTARLDDGLDGFDEVYDELLGFRWFCPVHYKAQSDYARELRRGG